MLTQLTGKFLTPVHTDVSSRASGSRKLRSTVLGYVFSPIDALLHSIHFSGGLGTLSIYFSNKPNS